METLYKIASKAEYIMDIARSVATQKEGNEIETVDTVMLNNILRQLENIADALDEYHDWGEEE